MASALHAVELPRLGSGGPPLPDELAVLVELGDAVGGTHAVGDVDVAGAIPRDVARLAERRPRSPRSRRWRRGPARPGTPAGGRRPAPHRPAPRRPAALPDGTLMTSGFLPSTSTTRPWGSNFTTGWPLVDGPDVVLRIDAQAKGGIEPVDDLPQLADEFAAGVELEQPRAAAIERADVPSVA